MDDKKNKTVSRVSIFQFLYYMSLYLDFNRGQIRQSGCYLGSCLHQRDTQNDLFLSADKNGTHVFSVSSTGKLRANICLDLRQVSLHLLCVI